MWTKRCIRFNHNNHDLTFDDMAMSSVSTPHPIMSAGVLKFFITKRGN